MMTTLWTGRRLVVMPQFEARAWLDARRARAHHARVRRADHDEAPARPARPRARAISSSLRGALLRRRADAVPGDPPRDRAPPEDGRLRERLRTDRDHVDADGARSRGPPARRRARTRSSARCGGCARSAGRCRTSRCASSTTTGGALGVGRGGRDPRAHAARDEGLRGRRRTRRSPRTAGCRRATSAGSTRTAISTSPAARTT